MADTTYYNLKKPLGTDYYNVEDFNDNADAIDAALHGLETGKVAASGGDISDTKAVTISAVTANYPEIQTNSALKVIFGRIKKFLADLKANCITGLSVSGRTITYTKAGGTTGTITTQDTTYNAASTSAAGLMSASDKIKLNGIESGAQVNAVTGVKGANEGSYRTGQINLTAANIGAANTSHASTESTFGLGNQSAYGHVKIIDSLDERAYSAGEALSAHMGGELQKRLTAGITGKAVQRDAWSWGGSFDPSTSYVTVWRSGDVVMVTFAAAIATAIPAKFDRNILTNLPAARNRVYAALTCVAFDNNSAPASIVGTAMCSIKPEENAAVLKIDKNLNPTALPYGTLYGTIVYTTSEA